MNNNDKLDELFGMARIEPSLISEEEVRNLLMENDNSYIPAKVNFVELIKGVPTMLKIGFAIAVATIGGLISTSMFDNSEQKIAQNQTKPKQIIIEKPMSVERNQEVIEQVNPDEPKQKKVYVIKQLVADTKESTEEVKNPIEPDKHAVEFKPVEVKGIQFITLSEEKLKLLGINTDNKELKYWNNWGTKDDKATLCTLFVNGGLAIRPKNNPDYNLIPNPGISPRLITDNKGNRRVFVIDDDESAVHSEYESVVEQSNGIKVKREIVKTGILDSSGNWGNHLQSVSKIFSKYELENSLDSLMQTKDSIILKDYYEKQKSKDKRRNNTIISQYDQKMTLSDSQQVAMRTIVTTKLDSGSTGAFAIHPQFGKVYDQNHPMIKKYLKDMDTTVGFDTEELCKQIDLEEGLTDQEKQQIKVIMSDLFKDSIRVILKNTTSTDSKTNIESEVITRNNTAVVRINVDKDSTNSDNNPVWNTSSSSGKITIPNFNSLVIEGNPVLMGDNSKLKFIESNIDEYIKINKLIPILVPFGKVESDNELIDNNNFGFILWYDPTPELLEVLPKEIREILEKELDSYSKTDDVCQSTAIAGEEPYLEVWRSCSGAIEHLNVNPVPANSIINVNYSLTEARRTTISIHDMFGNVIKELQSGKSEQNGNYTVEFDISRYESGMYLISVQTEIGEAAVQRIVIER